MVYVLHIGSEFVGVFSTPQLAQAHTSHVDATIIERKLDDPSYEGTCWSVHWDDNKWMTTDELLERCRIAEEAYQAQLHNRPRYDNPAYNR